MDSGDGDEYVLTLTTEADSAGNINASGRSTMFCCLACGMPFSFPDDAYTSRDKEVQEILRFVHRVRNDVRKDDRSRASTTQWQVCVCVCVL
jgi:hypothetical protein